MASTGGKSVAGWDPSPQEGSARSVRVPGAAPASVGCPRGIPVGSRGCCLPAGQLPPPALRTSQRLRWRCRNFFGRRLIV